jgi:hypothetical protein
MIPAAVESTATAEVNFAERVALCSISNGCAALIVTETAFWDSPIRTVGSACSVLERTIPGISNVIADAAINKVLRFMG